MKLLCSRSFHRSNLAEQEKLRCYKAIKQFSENPRHPGLNFERLGRGDQNHCSIRASKEIRVILAVSPDSLHPEIVALVWMDHHDAAYNWSQRHGFSTDFDQVSVPSGTQDCSKGMTNGMLPLQPKAGESLVSNLRRFDNLDEWMLFLHSDQTPLVQRKYVAEARIRGGAGTGKTVVALHRAAELARRYSDGKILFTTYSKSLTEYLGQLYSRIPGAPDNVEFRNIDRLARKFSDSDLLLDNGKIDAAFKQAYQETIRGTVLEKCGQDYLKDEVVRVIKGRAATRDEYLDTGRFQRLGRKRSFNRRDREQCWKLRETWDRYMQQSGCVDFAGILISARDRVRLSKHSVYRAAVVDEAQDMTTVGIQLVRALVAGSPENMVPSDGILILDDAAQRIYQGGDLISWAGLNVKGRSEILRTNYRNTEQIMVAARTVRGSSIPVKEDADDGAAWPERFDLPDGPKPIILRVQQKGEVPAIAEEVKKLISKDRIEPEAIGILTRENKDSGQLAESLRKKFSIPSVLLSQMRDERLGEGVRVGTFDRGKGLEFEAVFIPRIGQSLFPRVTSEASAQSHLDLNTDTVPLTDEEAEARQLELDRLYVGMTRARKWLFLVADEEFCKEIEDAWEHFDRLHR